jgi:hypothetical protein
VLLEHSCFGIVTKPSASRDSELGRFVRRRLAPRTCPAHHHSSMSLYNASPVLAAIEAVMMPTDDEDRGHHGLGQPNYTACVAREVSWNESTTWKQQTAQQNRLPKGLLLSAAVHSGIYIADVCWRGYRPLVAASSASIARKGRLTSINHDGKDYSIIYAEIQ